MANDTQERPLYRLTENAYIDDVLYDINSKDERFDGSSVQYNGVPGHHMIPLNAAAKARKDSPEGKKAARFLDPILEMTNVNSGVVSESTGALGAAIAEAIGKALSQRGA